MLSTMIDQLGDFNPQLFRELKGRLKPRNLAIVSAMSMVGQLLIYLYYESMLPHRPIYNRYSYCEYGGTASGYECLQDAFGHILINNQLWWLDLFTCISVIGSLILIVFGSYMLINDLAKEENRGTLGFVRFSPQSAATILQGKMLGVPVLLFWFVLLALPLHLKAGLSAQISVGLIFCFYGVLLASCIFFYSAALLYALSSKGLAGFQTWLGSGLLLLFLFITTGFTISDYSITNSPLDWLRFFNPGSILPYLVDSTYITGDKVDYFVLGDLIKLRWYFLPLWTSFSCSIAFTLINYTVGTYWIWRGLKRRFHNPNAALVSKLQSYWLASSFTFIVLGFALQNQGWAEQPQGLLVNFTMVFVFNLLLFLGLIAALTPHRQTIQDWARYRHQVSKKDRKNLFWDLLTGEKSPAIAAIAINLVITSVIILGGIIVSPLGEYKEAILWGVIFNLGFVLICAAIAQLMLFIQAQKRVIWTTAAVLGFIILPLVSFGVTKTLPEAMPSIWILSAVPTVALEHATITTIAWSLMGQWLAISVASGVIVRQIRQAGASETKILLDNKTPVI